MGRSDSANRDDHDIDQRNNRQHKHKSVEAPPREKKDIDGEDRSQRNDDSSRSTHKSVKAASREKKEIDEENRSRRNDDSSQTRQRKHKSVEAFSREENDIDEEDRSRRHDDRNRRRHKHHRRRKDNKKGTGKHHRHREESDHSDDGNDRKRRRRDDEKKRSRYDREEVPVKQQLSDQGRLVVRIDKSLLVPLGDPLGKVLTTQHIDPVADYFIYHQHLWVYLFREEGLTFNDLSSDEARAAFARFAVRYNEGSLERAYYDPMGLPAEALEECRTTRHNWSFRTSTTEDDTLHFLHKGIHRQTENQASFLPNHRKQDSSNASSTLTEKILFSSNTEVRDRPRVAGRLLREQMKTMEEELTGGRKDGRERQLEKKREVAGRIHGASREREVSGLEVADDVLYGGGADQDYQNALRRQQLTALRRDTIKNARIAELQQKEASKQEAMIKVLGLANLKPGEKIKIAPRTDG